MTQLILQSCAKINWTLEVLGKRKDRYHEVRSVMQTISLADQVRLTPDEQISISVSGGTRGLRREANEHPDSNLAYRAAQLLQQESGHTGGVSIHLYKHIPVASGLGGGSSNAAAVLRGLRRLWSLDIGDEALMNLAAELGSDVPFFLVGGTAVASGRGDVIEPLLDIAERSLVVGWPRTGVADDKTATMFGALQPKDYTDGTRTEQLAERLRDTKPLEEGGLYNVFEEVLAEADPESALRFEGLAEVEKRANLCGSGPAVYFLDADGDDIAALPDGLGFATFSLPRTVPAGESLRIDEAL